MNVKKLKELKEAVNISTIRNREEIKKTLNEMDPSIDDYYTHYDDLDIDALHEQEYEQYLNSLSESDKDLLSSNKPFLSNYS